MAQPQETGPVSGLCEVVEGSRRGFSASRPGQATVEIDVAEVTLVARVKASATQTGHRYGSRRMAKPFQAEGDAVGRDQARRLMPQAGVSVRRRTRCPVTPDRRHGDAVAPKLLARQFAVAPPDPVGVGEITDVGTAAGWESLAVLLDVHARQVVGWAMQSRIEAAWVQAARRMALGRRRPSAGLLHHADRGSQEACQADPTLLAAHGLRCRRSRQGAC
jgi:putative transposase